MTAIDLQLATFAVTITGVIGSGAAIIAVMRYTVGELKADLLAHKLTLTEHSVTLQRVETSLQVMKEQNRHHDYDDTQRFASVQNEIDALWIRTHEIADKAQITLNARALTKARKLRTSAELVSEEGERDEASQ